MVFVLREGYFVQFHSSDQTYRANRIWGVVTGKPGGMGAQGSSLDCGNNVRPNVLCTPGDLQGPESSGSCPVAN